jgi:protein-tyrosine phosphatase
MAAEFQYLIAMDHSNLRNMINEIGHKPDSLYLMRDFDDQNLSADVPDPYYGGPDGFEEVYQMLDRSLDNFLAFIRERHPELG